MIVPYQLTKNFTLTYQYQVVCVQQFLVFKGQPVLRIMGRLQEHQVPIIHQQLFIYTMEMGYFLNLQQQVNRLLNLEV